MTELGKTAALVRGMIAAVKIPVTAKMRLGWDADNLTAPELARVLEAEGVAALCVHGRTRAQGFGGQVNLAGIRSVVQAVKSIPVLGNGDVTTPEAAKTMIDETGCAGVAIGRGAFYDPWIFKRTDHFLRTGEMLPDATFAERLQVMRRHFERYVEFYGEERGAKFFRKVAPWYSRRFGPAKVFKQRIITIASRADFEAVLAEYQTWRARFCDERGELLPRFQPAPLLNAFDPANADGLAAIPVPKGPVDRW
jgi:nifR3 family TIM-barrel protein